MAKTQAQLDEEIKKAQEAARLAEEKFRSKKGLIPNPTDPAEIARASAEAASAAEAYRKSQGQGDSGVPSGTIISGANAIRGIGQGTVETNMLPPQEPELMVIPQPSNPLTTNDDRWRMPDPSQVALALWGKHASANVPSRVKSDLSTATPLRKQGAMDQAWLPGTNEAIKNVVGAISGRPGYKATPDEWAIASPLLASSEQGVKVLNFATAQTEQAATKVANLVMENPDMSYEDLLKRSADSLSPSMRFLAPVIATQAFPMLAKLKDVRAQNALNTWTAMSDVEKMKRVAEADKSLEGKYPGHYVIGAQGPEYVKPTAQEANQWRLDQQSKAELDAYKARGVDVNAGELVNDTLPLTDKQIDAASVEGAKKVELHGTPIISYQGNEQNVLSTLAHSVIKDFANTKDALKSVTTTLNGAIKSGIVTVGTQEDYNTVVHSLLDTTESMAQMQHWELQQKTKQGADKEIERVVLGPSRRQYEMDAQGNTSIAKDSDLGRAASSPEDYARILDLKMKMRGGDIQSTIVSDMMARYGLGQGNEEVDAYLAGFMDQIGNEQPAYTTLNAEFAQRLGLANAGFEILVANRMKEDEATQLKRDAALDVDLGKFGLPTALKGTPGFSVDDFYARADVEKVRLYANQTDKQADLFITQAYPQQADQLKAMFMDSVPSPSGVNVWRVKNPRALAILQANPDDAGVYTGIKGYIGADGQQKEFGFTPQTLAFANEAIAKTRGELKLFSDKTNPQNTAGQNMQTAIANPPEELADFMDSTLRNMYAEGVVNSSNERLAKTAILMALDNKMVQEFTNAKTQHNNMIAAIPGDTADTLSDSIQRFKTGKMDADELAQFKETIDTFKPALQEIVDQQKSNKKYGVNAEVRLGMNTADEILKVADELAPPSTDETLSALSAKYVPIGSGSKIPFMAGNGYFTELAKKNNKPVYVHEYPNVASPTDVYEPSIIYPNGDVQIKVNGKWAYIIRAGKPAVQTALDRQLETLGSSLKADAKWWVQKTGEAFAQKPLLPSEVDSLLSLNE